MLFSSIIIGFLLVLSLKELVLNRQNNIKLLLTLAVVLLAQNVLAQNIKPLNQEQQQRVEKLQEIIEYSKNRGEWKDAISSLNKIAFLYWDNGNTSKAVEYFERAVPLNQKIGNKENIKTIYSNIGLIYTDMEELDPALNYFRKSLKVRRELGNSKEIASGLIDVAYIMGLKGNYRQANKRLDEALKIALENEYGRMTVNIYNQLAKNYEKIGNIKKSNEYKKKYASYQEHLETQSMKQEYQEQQEQSEAKLRKARLKRQKEQAQHQLAQLRYERRQDSIQEVVQEKQDSLTRARRLDSLKQLRINQQEQKMELQEARLERQEAQQRVQQMIIYSVAGGLLLGIVLLVVMYRSNRARKKANQALAEKNREIEKKSEQLQEAFNKIEDQNIKITQSITYAQEIQKALFPPKENLTHYIPESFIFFQPVDLVSGDFYWFKELSEHSEIRQQMHKYAHQEHAGAIDGGDDKKGDDYPPTDNSKFVVSAVDCTGHGVPGAFMSMIGYNLLDEITQSGVSQPGRILRELHKGIRRTLKQHETNNRDGMDLSLCVVDRQANRVDFAGAKNPLVYIQDGEVHVIKGNRVPVGGMQSEKERYFSESSVQVDRPTWFYIFSDGYTDQFGGPKNRKYLLKNLKQLLLDIHQKPMEEQEQMLSQSLNNWMGDRENQIDDVLVIGFKLEPSVF